jgi:hypothetical protein
MKGTKNELRKVIRGLEALIRKAEKIEKGLSEEGRVVVRRRVGRPKAQKKAAPRRIALQAGKGRTATGMVFGIIKKNKRGATTTQIRNGTGFDEKKIWNVINRLKSQRKIKSARRGIYVAI